ncbi:tudor and KH domain-containing protein homolog isoform X2 [Orussus abietinus]|nr:tudor and KH domain-containing protein homolog isoform X2 [Orussus abietinus]XP_012288012.1 tudor and KH domain-containing protein homolog isoform X2 [Orussus abietinus]XP_012288013.1 tudor and KH domain-containing protein homolog isoform X2 [Orussus abietinus]XP_023288085.1 tudor and KH domain-containing protein homolog isoform X2 [Orussus abietinus]
MKWISHQILLPVLIGFSLTGIGATLLYLLFKKDNDDEINSRKTTVETSQQNVFQMKIPRQFVPLIIGRAGMMVKQLQSSTDTDISFESDNIENAERICFIKGKPESIRLAEAMIKNLIATQPVVETYDTFVPQFTCSKIIGTGGESIKQIQNSSNAKIIIDHSNYSNDLNAKTKITIKGTAEQIAAALSQIENKVHDAKMIREKLEASHALRSPRGKVSPRNTSVSVSDNTLRSNELLTQAYDSRMEVYVSAANNPSQFWVQVVGPGTVALDDLVTEMTLYYEDKKNRELHCLSDVSFSVIFHYNTRVLWNMYLLIFFFSWLKVTVGQIIAAKFSFDKRWYRAEIISINEEGMYGIYFIDYGDDDVKTADDLFELRTDFLSLRLQAVECSLANIKPRGGEWTLDACNKFYDLTWAAQWKVLIAKVRGYKERLLGQGRSRREGSPIPCIELYDKIDDKEINIGKELIHEGFADPDEGSRSAASSTMSISKKNHDVTGPSTPSSTPPLSVRAVSPEVSATSTPNSSNLSANASLTSKPVPVIDITTPKKPTSDHVEEIDLVTPVREQTNRFIESEKRSVNENGSEGYMYDGNSAKQKRDLRLSKGVTMAPAGYESDLSGDSDELEMF